MKKKQVPVKYPYIVSFEKLVRAAASGKLPLGVVIPNESYLEYAYRAGILKEGNGVEVRTRLKEVWYEPEDAKTV